MPLQSLSLQLYSVRDALDKDVAATLARVAEIGFTQVEASYKVLSREIGLLEAIRANDLASPTMTSPLLDIDLDAVFTTAKDLGAHTVIETVVREEHWTSPESVARVAEQLNAAAVKAAEYELRVAYHNHWWELEHRFDGRTALDTLTDHLRPEVLLEVDAYWVAVGGENVLEFLGRQSHRVHFLHLKDGPITRENSAQLPAGQGAMPLTDIIDAAPNLEVGVIEFDDYAGDVFEAVAASFAYLNPKVPA